MASQPIHSKLLNQAAREILKPLGLVQFGRSRLWIDDHGWWLINVEFQPSGWTKGSYLNVGVQWLWQRHSVGVQSVWHGHPRFIFHFGGRVGNAGFVEFHNPAQFAPEARRLAVLAADEVREYRSLFSNLTSIPTLLRKKNKALYAYHIAVAYGLLGQTSDALSFFDEALIKESFADWHYAENEQIRQLRTLLLDGLNAFRSGVSQIVHDQRLSLRLDPARVIELPR